MNMTPAPKSNLVVIFLAVLITAVAVGVLLYLMIDKDSELTITPTASTSLLTSVTPTITGTQTQQSRIYENQYLEITIPAGWSYSVAQTGAINITKDGYILYINPRMEQASGVIGGRFSEIARGAPSADAVIREHPSNPCGMQEIAISQEITGMITGHQRFDWYVNNQTTGNNCNAPNDGSTIWYFSYVSKDGYINYYVQDGQLGYVITMSFDSGNVNQLPRKDSKALDEKLVEMSSILETLVLK